MIKKLLIGLSLLILSVLGSGFWLFSLLDIQEGSGHVADTQAADLTYLENAVREPRGRILAVVTSTSTMGVSGKATGYELTELSRAYYVFTGNGFTVDIASPAGGEPPVVIDDEDMGPFDFAFLNDETAQTKVRNSLTVSEVDASRYDAVYFVGGKGAMWDFPDNLHIQRLVREIYEAGKVIGAVCHGPAALVNTTLSSGQALVAGRRVSGFTNEEELFLIPDAADVFPFLLQDGLVARGAVFEANSPYLEQVSHDGKLLTGQNPWSVWPLAEAIVRELGYPPIPRQVTADERSVQVLATYVDQGYQAARSHLAALAESDPASVNRNLIAMHGILAAMQWEVGKAIDLVKLTALAKSLTLNNV
jgi:putative intracellular protease/amidase